MPFAYQNVQNNAQYMPTGGKRGGRPLYCVIQPFAYWHFFGNDMVKVHVEDGFVTDLASIPNLPLFPSPKGTLWDDAAIVHDRALVEVRAGRMNRSIADKLFYHALRERGCSVFTATVFWFAVRINALVKGNEMIMEVLFILLICVA